MHTKEKHIYIVAIQLASHIIFELSLMYVKDKHFRQE